MSEFRKWPKTTTRTIIDFDRLIERLSSQGDTLICAPVALVDIIRKLLRDRGLWRTTYAKDQDDIGYTIPTVEEFKPVEDMISEFLWETSEMRCQDLITALNGIAAAVSGCCQNSGPGYISDGDGGFWYGSEEPLGKPDTFGGDGEFASESEFNEHLCQAANHIISGLILSLNHWSALSLAGLIAGVLIVAFIVTAPPLGVFLALGATGFAFGAMSTLSNYINDNRQEWVCAIFNSEGYEEMLTLVDGLIGDMVIDLDLVAFEVPLTQVIRAALSTDVFNQAYSVIGLPPVTDPVDCDGCIELDCQDHVIAAGSLTSGTWDNGDYVAETPEGETGHYIRLAVNAFPKLTTPFYQGDCGPERKFTVTATTAPVAANRIRIYNTAGSLVFNSSSELPVDVCGRLLVIADFAPSSAFTASILVEEDC